MKINQFSPVIREGSPVGTRSLLRVGGFVEEVCFERGVSERVVG